MIVLRSAMACNAARERDEGRSSGAAKNLVLPRIHDDALSADIRLGAHLKALNTHAERILRSALG